MTIEKIQALYSNSEKVTDRLNTLIENHNVNSNFTDVSSAASKRRGVFAEPDIIIFLGASITNGMISGNEANTIEYCASQGRTISSVVDSAVSGDELFEILARWESIKDSYKGNPAVRVFVHAGGNNVSNTRPYSTATEAELQTFRSDYMKLLSSIVNNGNVVVPATITYRAYSDLVTEDDGSKPYNDNIVTPIIEAVRKTHPDNITNTLDLYSYTKAYYEYMGSDGVHYTSFGSRHLRKLVIDHLLNQPGVTETFSEILKPESCMVFRSSANGGSNSALSWYGHNSVTDVRLPAASQNVISTVHFSTGGSVLTGTNSSYTPTGDVSLSLSADRLYLLYHYTGSTSFVEYGTFTGLIPGQRFVMSVVSSRATTDTDRVGEYTVDDGVTVVEHDASDNNNDNVLTLIGNADADGNITLKFRCKAGSQFAYVNACMLIPIED